MEHDTSKFSSICVFLMYPFMADWASIAGIRICSSPSGSHAKQDTVEIHTLKGWKSISFTKDRTNWSLNGLSLNKTLVRFRWQFLTAVLTRGLRTHILRGDRSESVGEVCAWHAWKSWFQFLKWAWWCTLQPQYTNTQEVNREDQKFKVILSCIGRSKPASKLNNNKCTPRKKHSQWFDKIG